MSGRASNIVALSASSMEMPSACAQLFVDAAHAAIGGQAGIGRDTGACDEQDAFRRAEEARDFCEVIGVRS